MKTDVKAELNVQIFFDLDGPILDVSRRHYEVYCHTVSSLGGAPLDYISFWTAKREKQSDERIAERSGIGHAGVQAFRRFKVELIESASFLMLDRIQEGVLERLEALANKHSLVLVTLRNSRLELDDQLQRLDLSRYFTAILSGRERGAEGWQLKTELIRGLNCPVSRADWLIGDTETDVLAGKALGIRTAAVTNGIRTEEFLRQLEPDLVIRAAALFQPEDLE